MSSFAISSASSFSLCNAYNQQPSRQSFILRNSQSRLSSNFEFRGLKLGREVRRRRTSLQCNCCSNNTGRNVSGENENRVVLDAFFLGKALAEVINERIESTVGEVLSNIGKFQAEQQKQVQEIQEEVLERAKKAKEKAARETVEAQGLVASKPATIYQKPTVSVVDRTVQSSAIMGGVFESSSSSDEDSV